MSRTVYVFDSDGEHMPAGEYFVEIFDSGDVGFAWRPNQYEVWGPPLRPIRREES